MLIALDGVLVVTGVLFWVLLRQAWISSVNHDRSRRIATYLVVPVLYGIGFSMILFGLGIDRADDSSTWYWDTWVLFSTMAGVSSVFAMKRFSGRERTILSVSPVVLLVLLVLYYLLFKCA